MRPNKPIKRSELLQIATEELRLGTSAPLPLGRVIQNIMDRLSPHKPRLERPSGMPPSETPVPLGEVAAYIDGGIGDPAAEEAITAAAFHDPGLMMELVMALKARSDLGEQVLPDPLRSRLVGLHQQIRTAAEATAAEATAPPLSSGYDDTSLTSEVSQTSNPIDQVLPPLDAPADAPADAAASGAGWSDVAIDTEADVCSPQTRQADRSTWASKTTMLVGLATAVAILLAIGWQLLISNEPGLPIAEDARTEPSRESIAPAEGAPREELVPNPGPRVDSMLVEQPAPEPDQPRADTLPEATNVRPETIAESGSDKTESMVADVPNRDPPNPPRSSPPGRRPTRPLPIPARQLVASWNQIDGLMLESETGPPLAPASESSSEPSSVAVSVAVGNPVKLQSDVAGKRRRLQTLPLCRAVADFDIGGQFVVAADTVVEFTIGGAIDLRYGSVAIVDAAKSLEFQFGPTLAQSISVVTSPGSSLVVQRTASGIEVDTHDSVLINGQSFEHSKIKVDSLSRTMERSEAPERLPRWTTERIDRIDLPRNVLAQLSQSDDVSLALRTSYRSGAVRGEGANLLRQWFVAANRHRLLRLMASDDAMVREFAFVYLRSIRPLDPRHRELWRRLRASASNQRAFLLVRTLLTDYWQGHRPPVARRDQLLRLLQAPESSTRAMADFLLRTFYGKGPPFVMDSNARLQTRTVNAWRAVMSRVDGV